MLKRGVIQSNRLIIEDAGLTDRAIIERIRKRVLIHIQDIKEVWIKRTNGIERIY